MKGVLFDETCYEQPSLGRQRNALGVAISKGSEKVLKMLLKLRVNINGFCGKESGCLLNPLGLAVTEKKLPFVR